MYIRDQTTHYVQSDLNLDCPQKPLVSTTLRKEFMPAPCVNNFKERVNAIVVILMMVVAKDKLPYNGRREITLLFHSLEKSEIAI